MDVVRGLFGGRCGSDNDGEDAAPGDYQGGGGRLKEEEEEMESYGVREQSLEEVDAEIAIVGVEIWIAEIKLQWRKLVLEDESERINFTLAVNSCGFGVRFRRLAHSPLLFHPFIWSEVHHCWERKANKASDEDDFQRAGIRCRR